VRIDESDKDSVECRETTPSMNDHVGLPYVNCTLIEGKSIVLIPIFFLGIKETL
jgi:hypothetical protein